MEDKAPSNTTGTFRSNQSSRPHSATIRKVVAAATHDVLQEIWEPRMTLDQKFVDMGASSIDRAFIVDETISVLRLSIESEGLVICETIEELADSIYDRICSIDPERP